MPYLLTSFSAFHGTEHAGQNCSISYNMCIRHCFALIILSLVVDTYDTLPTTNLYKITSYTSNAVAQHTRHNIYHNYEPKIQLFKELDMQAKFVEGIHMVFAGLIISSLSVKNYDTSPTYSKVTYLNSSPPGQNGLHYADDIFRCLFLNEKFCILIKILMKFVPKGPINNNPALV